jgi:hypothetical protein
MLFTMIKRLYRLAYGSLLLWQMGCAGEPKLSTKLVIKPPISFPIVAKQSVELDTKFIADAVKADDKSIGFYCGINKLYGREYFIYLDKGDSLVFIDMASQEVHKTNIRLLVKKLDEYTVGNVEGHNLFLLNNERKTFYQYTINIDFSVTPIKEVDLNSTGIIGKTNLRVSPDANRFIVMDTLLFVNYSKRGSKNFIGETTLMRFDLNTPSPKPTFILPYPDKYTKERIYLSELLFTPFNDSCIAFAFFQSDVIGIYNIKTNTALQTTINRKAGYLSFDESRERNLGYVAKYLLTNENNYKLLADSLQRLYLFKQLAKAQKTDTAVVECYVYDAGLNPVHCFRLGHNVSYFYIFKYQKGFLAFTKDLTKAYYYEF